MIGKINGGRQVLQKKKTSEQIAEELEESVEVIEKIIKVMQ